jgi:hypothetical protein
MRTEVCFDAATEGATGGMLGLLPTRLCNKGKGWDAPKVAPDRLVSKAASLSSETTLEDAQDAQHHVGHY